MLERVLCKEFAAELRTDETDTLRDRLGADEGGRAGNGLSNSLVSSRNSRSNPGCICLAIIGKLLRSSEKDLTSFFFGNAVEEEASFVPDAFALRVRSAAAASSVAGMIGIDSRVPTSGFVI